MRDREVELSDDLFARVCEAIKPGDEIETLSRKRTNRIAAVHRSGVTVESVRSENRGTGPQLVPAWMISEAWQYLLRQGELSQQQLLIDLKVKRSAVVFALLAQFP